jgi:phage terminase large subunit-like protein
MSGGLGKLPADERQLLFALMSLEHEHDARAGSSTGWPALARPEQRPPAGDWRTWLILAGRGWGKTRTGAETIAAWASGGHAHEIAVVGQTLADMRDIAMAALRRAAGPTATYIESRHFELRFANGARARGFSAEEPDSLRGYEFDTAWSDELAAWRYPEAFDQLQFGLRAPGARQIVTTTPRPTPLIRRLLADPTTATTGGRTIDNAANLDPATLGYYLATYAGTRLGRQELDAEVLLDLPGALWTRDRLDEMRVAVAPELVRIVVAIDPAVSSAEGADETGIVVAGKGIDGKGYVLADLSCRASPDGWARRAVDALTYWNAREIVAEANQGGDLVEATIRTVRRDAPYRAVRATKGKRLRAEPIAALYEQGRVHHVGSFGPLEDQLCAFVPEAASGPDDRLDALVWALTELDLAGSEWDIPGMEQWARGVWWCVCDRGFIWQPDRPCPYCGRRAPATYPRPLDGSPTWTNPADAQPPRAPSA